MEKLHYFGHLMQTADSLEKSLMLGKIEGRKKRLEEDEMIRWHHLLKGHEFEQTLGDGEELEAWCAAVHWVTKVGHDLITEQQQHVKCL